VVRSDLFEGLEEGARFDVVCWNSNFIELPDGHVSSDILELAIFDPGYATHQAFLEQVMNHTEPNGRVFLGFSNLGNLDLLQSLARQAGLRLRTLRSFTVKQPVTLTYQLLELVRM
jgi:release factor glutamine methyltransferase